MTATIGIGPVRRERPATVQSYVRLTASTFIHCCTYEDAAPILTIQDGAADITITNPGRGEVTEEDVRFGRLLAEAVTRYAAELEKLAAKDPATAADPDERRAGGVMAAQIDGGGAARAGTSGRPWVLSRVHERGDQAMRKVITGEQVAQLYNRDPFALPRLAGTDLPDPCRVHPAGAAGPAAGLAGPADRPAPAGRRHPGRAGPDVGEHSAGWAWSSWPPGPWWSWPRGGSSGRARSPGGSAHLPGADGGPGSTGAAGPG